MMLNIIDFPERDIPKFCVSVALKAIADHRAMRKTARTGRELCAEFCEEWRRGHLKLAATVYRSTRWSLAMEEKERAELAGSPSGTNRKDTP